MDDVYHSQLTGIEVIHNAKANDRQSMLICARGVVSESVGFSICHGGDGMFGGWFTAERISGMRSACQECPYIAECPVGQGLGARIKEER